MEKEGHHHGRQIDSKTACSYMAILFSRGKITILRGLFWEAVHRSNEELVRTVIGRELFRAVIGEELRRAVISHWSFVIGKKRVPKSPI